MMRDWDSNRKERYFGNRDRFILEWYGKNICRTKDGWFFFDETEADSFGPFETVEECDKSMADYAAAL